MEGDTGTTVAGNADGSSGLSKTALHFPAGIVLDEHDNMYFTDRENHRVMYWEKGALEGSTYAGTEGVAGDNDNQFKFPTALERLLS
ncbi:unnamed protein product [Rotaria sordida]|uniref:Uncharacterized protein n=1 Tax=Rotaria sordida TaxID=392033 RepID=A0A815LWB6_9BILA|nr:unnamed protein product [Rotaria sordida]CAF1416151.1 unnamed protein product [Rotaria sordida]